MKKIISHALAIGYNYPKTAIFFLGILFSLGLPPFNLYFFSVLSFSLMCILLDNWWEMTAQLLILPGGIEIDSEDIEDDDNNLVDEKVEDKTPIKDDFQYFSIPLSKFQAFFSGIAFGIGYFLPALYWVSISLFVDIERYFWLLPLTILGVPFILSLFYGFGFWLFRTMNLKSNIRIVSLIIIITLIEFIRSYVPFAGFPWNLIGYNLSFSDILIQNAALISIYGLTIVSLFFCSSIYFLIVRNFRMIIFIFILALSQILGGIFLEKREKHDPKIVKLRLIQPNISQHQKWLSFEDNLAKLLTLTNQPSDIKPDLIIWPEAAVTEIVSEEIVSYIRSNINNKADLLTGIIWRENNRFFNSAIIINNKYLIKDVYKKAHLLPFAEYIPESLKFLPTIQKFTHGNVDFTPGNIGATIESYIFNIKPLICYEAIFPSEVEIKDADFLVNITNDAWFGYSIGPYQHFYMARIRAIENGIPLVRVANTGISGVIDSFGNILYKSELQTEDVIDIELNLYKLYKFSFNRQISLFFFLLASGLFIGYASKENISQTIQDMEDEAFEDEELEFEKNNKSKSINNNTSSTTNKKKSDWSKKD